MSVLTSKRAVIAVGVLAAVLIAGLATFLVVRADHNEVEARANCNEATAFAELAVENEDGALEVSAEISGAVPGEAWQVTVLRDGDSLLDAQRTADTDGEVDVDAFSQDTSGGAFTFEATSAGGTTCRVSVDR